MNNYRLVNGIISYRSCIIFLLLIMVLSNYVAAADTMFRANAEHTGVFDNGGIVTTNTELWRFKTGGFVESAPSLSNGVVYVGSNSTYLYAIDAVTGIEKWRFKTGNSVYSSPAISNGVVYVGSFDSNLYAIDAVTGIEKWRFATKNTVFSSPSESNGVVYVGSRDGNLYAVGGVSTSQGDTQTTVSPQTISPNQVADTTEFIPIWDRNILIYLVLLVFVLIFGALVYDMYYKKKK